MMRVKFDTVLMTDGSPGFQIVCGRCGTRAFADDDPSVRYMLTSIFTRRGWFVSDIPSQDRCPGCVAA